MVLLDAAVVGAVLGLLVALRVIEPSGATRALFDAGPSAGPYPWSVLGAMLAGAGGAALSVGRALFDSVWGLCLWLATGLSAGLCIAFVRVRGEEHLLRLGRFRAPSMQELRRLAHALQLGGSGLNSPGSPRFAVVETETALARPMLRHVVVSTGLLAAFDDEELAAVLVHAEHHRRRGDVLRDISVVVCGWPVLVLAGLGKDPSAGPRPGLPAAVARLVTWPATLAVRVVLVPVLEGRRHRAEYEADASARRAGLAKAMDSALSKAPAVERSGRTGAVLAAADPPLSFRSERLRGSRPLDAFFRDPSPEGRRTATRRGWALAAATAIVVVLASGAMLSAADSAASRHQAVRTAAAFTASYLDNAFDPAATRRVVSSFVRPAPSSDRVAAPSGSPVALAVELAAGDVRPGRATATACRFVGGSGSSDTSQVVVSARWPFYVAGALRAPLLTGTVPMTWSGGRWMPTGAPAFTMTGGPGPAGRRVAPTGSCS